MLTFFNCETVRTLSQVIIQFTAEDCLCALCRVRPLRILDKKIQRGTPESSMPEA